MSNEDAPDVRSKLLADTILALLPPIARFFVNATKKSKRSLAFTNVREIDDAFAKLIESVRAGVVKTDHSLTLRVREHNPIREDRISLTITAKYVVKNPTDKAVTFNILAQVESISDSKPRVPCEVIYRKSGTDQVESRNRIDLIPEYRNYAGDNTKKISVDLGPMQSCAVEWTAGPFDAHMPYADYWATVIPSVGLKIAIDHDGQFESYARGYYSEEGDHALMLHPGEEDDEFHAPGPILPYQGVMLEIRRKAIKTPS